MVIRIQMKHQYMIIMMIRGLNLHRDLDHVSIETSNKNKKTFIRMHQLSDHQHTEDYLCRAETSYHPFSLFFF